VGLVAVVVFVIVAAGLSNLVLALVQPDSPEAQFALQHFVSLPILVVAAFVFARWSGWWGDIWAPTSPDESRRPRRLWMLAIPVLMLVNPIGTLVDAPWGERSTLFVVSLLAGCILIGVAEELTYRGILRVSLRAHHGEFLTVIVTALLFGLSHSLGSILNGVPASIIAFQVAMTSLDGVFFYAAFIATRTLWVPIAIHALTDFSLYVETGNTDAATGHGHELGPVGVTAQIVLGLLALVYVIGAARGDLRARRERKNGATPA